MATATNNKRQLTFAERKERNAEELKITQSEVKKELAKLIDKIGIVNVLALLYGLNEAAIADVYSPYSKDFAAYGWFSLKNVDDVAVNVDTDYRWQERWCRVKDNEIQFGQK